MAIQTGHSFFDPSGYVTSTFSMLQKTFNCIKQVFKTKIEKNCCTTENVYTMRKMRKAGVKVSRKQLGRFG